jgi:hypothetical protein
MKRKYLLTALTIMGIGFAAVSTTLLINGTATISSNDEDFKENILFTAAAVDGKAIEGFQPSKEITFTAGALDDLGDKSTLTFTITNDSTYDAEFGANAIVCTSTHADYGYLKVTPGTELNGKKVATGSSIDSKVDVELAKSYVGEETKDITFKCEINANALEAADMN